MSSQEAAWYLLGLHMSESSRAVIGIPTEWPMERHLRLKPIKIMEEEKLLKESTNIWLDNIFVKYEKRPKEFENLCLADFASTVTVTRMKNGAYKYSNRKEKKKKLDIKLTIQHQTLEIIKEKW